MSQFELAYKARSPDIPHYRSPAWLRTSAGQIGQAAEGRVDGHKAYVIDVRSILIHEAVMFDLRQMLDTFSNKRI